MKPLQKMISGGEKWRRPGGDKDRRRGPQEMVEKKEEKSENPKPESKKRKI